MRNDVSTGLFGSYLKIAIATLLGGALALGIYFLASQGAGTGGQSGTHPSSLCICPNCGFTVPRPAGMDCEEINCPSCGHAMTRASLLAAATRPLTQNQRETLAEQGVATPGRMTENQRETLAGQQLTRPAAMTQNQREALADLRERPTRPAPQGVASGALTLPPIAKQGACVCPHCGTTLDRQPGAYCSHMRCPSCGTAMTNAIYVGQANPPANERLLAAVHVRGTGAGQPCPQTQTAGGDAPPCQQGNAGGGAPPCQQMRNSAPGSGFRQAPVGDASHVGHNTPTG